MHTQSRGAGLLAPTQAALPPFRLVRPATLAEAEAVLTDRPDATIAAGCTDLVASIREGHTPATLVSLRRVDELRTIEHNGGVLRIGALNTHDHGSRHPVLMSALPELGAAWSSIATVRIRFRATVGGNLMARRPRYEMPVILGALEATMEFGADQSERACTVDEFVRRDPAVPAGRLLRHFAVDTASLCLFGYDRSMRPLTTVALAVRRSGGGLRLTAVAGSEYRRPALLSAGASVADVADLKPGDRAELAHELAAQLPDRAGDYAGSTAYRRRVIAVLLRRRLESAAGREGHGMSDDITAEQPVGVDVVLNGRSRHAEVATSTILLSLLREEFGMTGVRGSCERGVCGACTVLMAGRPVASCSVFAFDADGVTVETIEGQQDGETLSPVQEAFAECGGFQCGYCTPGMIMLATALLRAEKKPDREEIRRWIGSNICCCTGYEMIMESVERAAEALSADHEADDGEDTEQEETPS